MNALEKVEKQQEHIKALSERIFEIHEVMQRVMPIIDGLVEVVGREKVLEAAGKVIEVQRDAHVSALMTEYENRAKAGEYTETETVVENSILFVSERRVGQDGKSVRVLPMQALAEDVRKQVMGIKVNDLVDPSVASGVEIKVERIFTPAQA